MGLSNNLSGITNYYGLNIYIWHSSSIHGGSFNETFQIICNCHLDYSSFLFYSGWEGEQKIPWHASNYVIKFLLSWNFDFTTFRCELQNDEMEINHHHQNCKMTGRGLHDSKLINYCVNDLIKSYSRIVHLFKIEWNFVSFSICRVFMSYLFQWHWDIIVGRIIRKVYIG